MDRKALTIAVRKAVASPTAEQLAAIAQFTVREMKAEELYVREYIVGHNAIDRDRECFDEALLGEFARTFPGKGLFVRHPTGWDGDTGPGEGRIFAARVEQMSLEDARKVLREPNLQLPPDRSMVSVLYASAYIAVTGDNECLRTKLDAGVAGDVSIGFSAAGTESVNDRSGNSVARRWKAPGEALELSLVWLGAQPGARTHKNATREGNAVDQVTKEQLDTANKAASDAQADLKAAQPKAKAYDAAAAALGDANKALLEQPTELAKAVADGQAFRKSLVDDIVAADRASGRVKADTEEEVASIKAAYAAMPTAALKTLHEGATKGAAGVTRLAPSDPNSPTQQPGGGKAAKRPEALDTELL